MSDVSVAPQGQAVANQASTPTGQGSPAPSKQAGISQSAASQSGQPFHKFTYPDGKEMVFNSPDDLDKAFRESFMRTQDYTKKTMAHADAVKKFQKEKEAHDAEYKQTLESKKRYDTWDQLMKTRPDISKMLTQAVNQPAGPQTVYERSQAYADEKYGELQKKLEELDQWKQQRELEDQRNSVYSRMKEVDPNFDSTKVEPLLEELATGEMEPLIKVLWDAARGRESPAKLEAKIKKSLDGKNGSGMIPGSGTPGSKTQYNNLREAQEAARREYGSSTE